MAEQVEVKTEALPDLDDLLQCPVCYELPSGQIFQCNEGHHVCGRCKARLDMCPVCRAFFFGTRNYAMEELIANIRKLRAFKLGGKVTTGMANSGATTSSVESSSSAQESSSTREDSPEEDDSSSTRTTSRPSPACKGLFRCLCCKNGNGERLPSGRLLNHLRYYHSPDLIEGASENGEYVQAWQFSTEPGQLVTAVRIADMGIFFLVIEITDNSLTAWLSMASAPWVAHEFGYTVTITGNDREAIFTDCVWSVRACEGALKKRGHCLIVSGRDALALIAAQAIGCKLSVRRIPADQVVTPAPPRAVLRVANRSNNNRETRNNAHNLEPFLQDLQNDVARLSRAFATLGREANALVSEAESRTRDAPPPARPVPARPVPARPVPARPVPASPPAAPAPDTTERVLSRNARRRMRQRLRAAFNDLQPSSDPAPVNGHAAARNGRVSDQAPVYQIGFLMAEPAPRPTAAGEPSSGRQDGNPPRTNKKKRRQRR